MGDEIIRFTARVLSEELPGLSPRAHLGHLGGDDFVIVCAGLVAEPALERICRIFDEARLSISIRKTASAASSSRPTAAGDGSRFPSLP